jgi:chromosome segregation ATPase
MKLLYFGNERLDAQNLATAVRAIARNGTVSWTTAVERASAWIAENRDVAALVVEAQIDGDSWRSLLQYVRGLAPRPAVIVVAPEGAGAAAASSVAGADHYVERNSPEFRDLPMVVIRAVASVRGSQHKTQAAVASTPHGPGPSTALGPEPSTALGPEPSTALTPGAEPREAADPDRARLVDLEQKLAEASAALRDAEQRHAAAIAAAEERLAQRQLQHDAATAAAAARWDVVDEQLRAAAVEAESARQNYAAAAAKAERLSRREAELSAQLAAAAAKNDAAEAALAQAARARDAAETLHASAVADLVAQLHELEAALGQSRRDREASAGEVARLCAREAELSTTLADARTDHTNLERRLAATEAAFKEADERATRERLAVARKAAAREAELEGQIRQERDARGDLERALTEAGTARAEAQQRHDAALAAAALDLAEHQGRFERELSQTAAARDRLGERVSEIEGILEQVRTDHRSATSEVERLSHREAELSSRLAGVAAQLADVQAVRQTVEHRLAEVIDKATAREAELDAEIQLQRAARADLERNVAAGEAARQEAQQQHEAALAAAAGELAGHQARFDRELSQIAAERERLADRVRESEGVLAQVRAAHESATTEVARLTQREMDLSAQLANAAAQLAETEAARLALDGRLAEAVDRAASREAELDARIQAEMAERADLERTFAGAEAAWIEAQQHHEAALAVAARTLGEHRDRLERELSQTAADRDGLSERLSEMEDVLAQTRSDRDAANVEVARLTQRESDLTSRLTSEAARLVQVDAARQSAERQLTETLKALEETNERARRDRDATAAAEADLEARLARETETRHALERAIAELRAAAEDAARAFTAEADTLRADARELQQRLEAQLGRERTEHERERTELSERNADLVGERDRLEQSRAAAQERSRQLDVELSEARTAHQATLDRLTSEHTTAVSALRAESQQLHAQLAATARDLEITRQRLNFVQVEADMVPNLRRELGESRAENGRLFQQAGLAMFRCTPHGELTQANRAAMTLVGRRTPDELRGAQFAAAVFEDPNGLSWLIERCLSTRARETIETTWRRKDGGRLFVRLSAYACTPDVIEILAEDLTRVHVLQDRLGQAQRIEAVGRLASEVAVTCGNLLDDIHRQVHESLVSAGSTAASRQQGQQLLAEVTRAAALMRQLFAYGDEQARTPALADLNEVIHDLGPVLKSVAGDAVDVLLPSRSTRLNVDVGAERIERLLVNLASHGRARMPFGGQLKIELDRTIVDRRFAAKHPNVRLGPHALITVTETRAARRPDDLSSLRGPKNGTPLSGGPEYKSAMDFGTLQGLVGGCGGHLWMTVQPEGDMIAKIRLPLLTSHEETAPRTLVARGGRVLTRLFQH